MPWGSAMGLAILLIGLALLLGAHTFVTLRAERAALVTRFGEGTYKTLFALVSLLGLALIVWGFAQYRATGWVNVWYPPAWTRHVTVALMWPAFILVVASYSRGRIYARLKHPFLAGVKLWALAHLISNGDLGSIILFGSLLAWSVYDRISLKRRTDPGAPNIPLGGARNDVIAIVVGTLLYLAFGFLHPYIIGAPAFSR
jgi:uncharacterized membrane protein